METFVVAHWYLFLALIAVILALFAQPLLESVSGAAKITPGEAIQIINRRSGVVIDVREPNEFKTGHIVRAINIPLSEVEKRGAELKKYKERPLILCCISGVRSARAATVLRRQGFNNTHNLAGGINAWRSQNLPLES